MTETRGRKAKVFTEDDKKYILDNYGKISIMLMSRKLKSDYYKVKNIIDEWAIDGYDRRYMFAKSKGFKLVSDALDKYGKQGFEKMYKQSLS